MVVSVYQCDNVVVSVLTICVVHVYECVNMGLSIYQCDNVVVSVYQCDNMVV